MKPPPLVLDRGMSEGVLHLVVLACLPGTRAYRVDIRCEIYGAFEGTIYSVALHGDGNGAYNGTIDIKEAISSRLSKAFRDLDPAKRSPRQFPFVGADFCIETLGFAEPTIHPFASREEGCAWAPALRDVAVRNMPPTRPDRNAPPQPALAATENHLTESCRDPHPRQPAHCSAP